MVSQPHISGVSPPQIACLAGQEILRHHMFQKNVNRHVFQPCFPECASIPAITPKTRFSYPPLPFASLHHHSRTYHRPPPHDIVATNSIPPAMAFLPPAPLSRPRAAEALTTPPRPYVAHPPRLPHHPIATAAQPTAPPKPALPPPRARIVLICGFETFNLHTYKAAAATASRACIDVTLLTERDLCAPAAATASALARADVVYASLIFDYDHVQWLLPRLPPGHVFVFESALELMSATRVGAFRMNSSKGMPNGVRVVLRKLGLVGREEDKLAGYLALLKNAPRLLKLVPGRAARDLANWLTVYSYWNAGGVSNVANMLEYITREVLLRPGVGDIDQVVQIPNVGLLHPEYDGFFEHPAAYVEWYERRFPERRDWPRVAVLLYRKHVVSRLRYIGELIAEFEQAGLVPLPVFITGVEAHIIVRDYLTSVDKEAARKQGKRLYGTYRKGKTANVDAVVSTIGFPLVGGPAGSMAGGRNADVGQVILQQLNVPYIVAAPLLIQDIDSWKRNGVAGLQSVVLYSLPELDGAIDTVCIGGLVGEEIYLLKDRVERLTGRLKNWITLRRKPNVEKKVAIIIYGFPPSTGATGTAALLNVPQSLSNILKRLENEGYDVGNGASLTSDQILTMVKEADEVLQGGRLDAASAAEALRSTKTVKSNKLREWLGPINTKRIELSWNSDVGSSNNIKTVNEMHLLGGVEFGNVWIGVQPPLGIVGDPMRMMFERDLTPHPQYAAFYRWLEKGLGADATVHVGTHGTYEWLPGNPLGNTKDNWSDIFMGNLPNLYVYAANNPSEGSLAKRRGYATIISHNVPPYGRAALYGQLDQMKSLVWEFNEAMQAGGQRERLEEITIAIEDKLVTSGLNVDLGIDASEREASEYVAEVSNYLKTLESRLFSSGLHILGKAPTPEEAVGFVEAILGDNPDAVPEEDRLPLARAITASVMDVSSCEDAIDWTNFSLSTYREVEELKKATEVLKKLLDTGNELDNVVRGLNGEFIEALPGGDVLRDGISVLPTGSNIHALDPYRLPSPSAYLTGRAIAERVIEAHRNANDGNYPETIAVPLWGLDNIKTKGESVGIALGLIGAEPVLDGTGRVVRFELVDLEKLGRPRVDVLLNLSGIFRDSFEHVVFLLDDMCRRAAVASEPAEMNFVKKHAMGMTKDGEDVDAGARLFSNPPADYGSMVNEQVADSTWENGDELADTFVNRNAYVYGRSSNGKRDQGTLKKMLSTTSRVVQQIDSVEYGLSDIQEYYANTGALLRAARVESKNEKVGASIVESFGAARDGGAGREPKDLEQVLRMELRTRLLNPKWAEKMLENGTGGAFEVSSRMTALIGWGGTAGYGDDFVFEQAAERYVLDEKNSEILRKTSPEAYRNVLSRFLEASGRGIWQNADQDLLQRIRDELEDVDSEIEGVDI